MLTARQKKLVIALGLPENAEVFFGSRLHVNGEKRRGWYLVQPYGVRFLGKNVQEAQKAEKD